MRERHFVLLDSGGGYVGSVWATKVEPKGDPADGFVFFRGHTIVAACWKGYKDVETGRVVHPGEGVEAAIAGEPLAPLGDREEAA